MKNKYLVNSGYYKQYIKNDLNSLLLYFDHFSQGLFLPKYLSTPFIRNITHKVLRAMVIFMYLSKLYKLIYKVELLNEDAIIIVKGQGLWRSTVRLIKVNDKLIILKKVHNNDVYLREKKFYEEYKNNKSRIRLPKHTFLKDNKIEIEFIETKSFQRLIIDGTCNLDKTMDFYNDIKNELKIFYKNKPTLIHGDMYLSNIFIKNDKYYLIDYSDSYVSNYNYDYYVLLFSILASFFYISISDKTIKNIVVNNKKTEDIIGISKNKIKEIENEFCAFRAKKFPKTYL